MSGVIRFVLRLRAARRSCEIAHCSSCSAESPGSILAQALSSEAYRAFSAEMERRAAASDDAERALKVRSRCLAPCPTGAQVTGPEAFEQQGPLRRNRGGGVEAPSLAFCPCLQLRLADLEFLQLEQMHKRRDTIHLTLYTGGPAERSRRVLLLGGWRTSLVHFPLTTYRGAGKRSSSITSRGRLEVAGRAVESLCVAEAEAARQQEPVC